MNLSKKKKLAAKTLKIGKDRVVFLKSRLDEIKEVITKQDIRDLYKEGAIIIKEKKGKRKIKKKKRKIGPGKIRRKPDIRKQDYVIIVRKLRNYASEMKRQGKITKEGLKGIRKKIRNREFRNKANLKEYIRSLEKWKQQKDEEESIKQIIWKD